ncbi:MAG: hypothetical protein K0R15_1960 [Clostridiales bacterium]|jgi:hypothetical protein|nr:hypothetical protein [Clostridiales bacterium]
MKISQMGETVTQGTRDFTIGQKMLVDIKGKKTKASLVEAEVENETIKEMLCQIEETLECVKIMPSNVVAEIEIDFMIKSSDGSNEIVQLETKLNEALIAVINQEVIEALDEDIEDAHNDRADLYVRLFLPYEGGERDWTEVSILEQD